MDAISTLADTTDGIITRLAIPLEIAHYTLVISGLRNDWGEWNSWYQGRCFSLISSEYNTHAAHPDSWKCSIPLYNTHPDYASEIFWILSFNLILSYNTNPEFWRQITVTVIFTDPKKSRQQPFATWFMSLMCCMGGGMLVHLFTGKPAFTPLLNTQVILP